MTTLSDSSTAIRRRPMAAKAPPAHATPRQAKPPAAKAAQFPASGAATVPASGAVTVSASGAVTAFASASVSKSALAFPPTTPVAAPPKATKPGKLSVFEKELLIAWATE